MQSSVYVLKYVACYTYLYLEQMLHVPVPGATVTRTCTWSKCYTYLYLEQMLHVPVPGANVDVSVLDTTPCLTFGVCSLGVLCSSGVVLRAKRKIKCIYTMCARSRFCKNIIMIATTLISSHTLCNISEHIRYVCISQHTN